MVWAGNVIRLEDAQSLAVLAAQVFCPDQFGFYVGEARE